MKIVFVVNTTGLTGGIKVIFEHTNRLIEKGHQVLIIHPFNLEKSWLSKAGFLAFLKWIKYNFLRIFNLDKINWFSLRAKVLRVPRLCAKYLPSADIIVATANETADWVAQLLQDKGEKFYFIQDYEIWTREKEKVESTYKLPLKKIVIASWLLNLIEEKFKEKVYGLVTNGVDLDIFNVPKKKFNQNKCILMLYHILEKKGIKDGIKAYKIAKKEHPEIQLFMFSAYPRGKDVPKETKFYYKPSQKKLKELYAACDIFLSPSHQEGCQLPPMEAMASQSAVVATSVGGVPDYTVPFKTALIVPPKRPDLLAKALLELLDDEEKLKKIAQAGYQYIKKFTWERATEKLEKIFQNEIS